ncbi:alpha/beta hydrolase [Paenibacillus sp. YYML68]|uniref:alpha/beta hydrolase n=1 Tax=Paenibacillus sp. YYML68 TaxID=2909250 RepID=UPI0024921096|nr:alpha/beta hydrolase [Paenibacillus sp. YYML68]
MRTWRFTFTDAEQVPIHTYRWLPEEQVPVRGIVQIAHGLAETAGRYARFAECLTANGYAVYANDHRGHGLTAGSRDRLTDVGAEGFGHMVDAMRLLSDIARQEQEGVPLYVMGHSMGTFLTLQYMYRYPGHADGIMLSAPKGPSAVHAVGYRLAKLMYRLQGAQHHGWLLNRLVTGAFNKPFRPNRTPFDWLTRDEGEVDRFIADEYCGSSATNALIMGMLGSLVDIFRTEHLLRIPREQPIYMFAGDQDPLGENGRSFMQLVHTLTGIGMLDVTYRLYPGGRHEMLNETNRDEVVSHVLEWLGERSRVLR